VFIINACFPSRSITAGCRMEKVQVPFPWKRLTKASQQEHFCQQRILIYTTRRHLPPFSILQVSIGVAKRNHTAVSRQDWFRSSLYVETQGQEDGSNRRIHPRRERVGVWHWHDGLRRNSDVL
jgi:hypothetical protein